MDLRSREKSERVRGETKLRYPSAIYCLIDGFMGLGVQVRKRWLLAFDEVHDLHKSIPSNWIATNKVINRLALAGSRERLGRRPINIL